MWHKIDAIASLDEKFSIYPIYPIRLNITPCGAHHTFHLSPFTFHFSPFHVLSPHNAQPDAKAHGEVVDVFAEEVPGLEAVVVACLGSLARSVACAKPCISQKVLIAVLIAKRAEQSAHAHGRA